MYDIWNPGDKPRFILNDFDLAARLDPDNSSENGTSGLRTGTLPFLSIEHLRALSMPGNVREDALYHDYQSLFWVAVYCMIKYKKTSDSKEKKNIQNALQAWEANSFWDIVTEKTVIISYFAHFTALPVASVFRRNNTFECIDKFRKLFTAVLDDWDTRVENAYKTKLDPSMTGDELDNMVTRDMILEALSSDTGLSSA